MNEFEKIYEKLKQENPELAFDKLKNFLATLEFQTDEQRFELVDCLTTYNEYMEHHR